jgi:hypothetical protein
LRFQYLITTFELVCTSNFDTMFIWLHEVTFLIIMQKMLFFYSPLLIQIIGSQTTLGRWQVGSIIVAMSRWWPMPIATVISVATGAVMHSSPLLLWPIKIQKQKINIYTIIIHQKSVPKAKHIYRQSLSIKSQYQKLNIYTTIISIIHNSSTIH